VPPNRFHARVDRPSAPLPAPQALETGEAPAVEDHVLLIDVGPADKIELAMESIGKTFSKIERRATVI
jgi:hypothetical protein